MFERDQLHTQETSQAPIRNRGRHRFGPLIVAGASLLLAIACAQPIAEPTSTSEPTVLSVNLQPTALPTRLATFTPAVAINKPEVSPTRTAISTAVVAGGVVETPVVSPITVTKFSFTTINPNEVGIDFCTQGRPVGTTLRVSRYRDANIDPSVKIDSLDPSKWEAIKELGVPCFNTNPANPDGPIWRTENLPAGNYLIRAQARPSEANGNWNDRTVKVEYKVYTLRKP